jgi:exodeoxyribonuclease VII small subunit
MSDMINQPPIDHPETGAGFANKENRGVREYSQFDRIGHHRLFLRVREFASLRMKAISKPPPSFEAALQELEGIVQTLEGGGAPLEDSLKAYERGVSLLDYCQSTLGQAEQKIHILDNGSLRELARPATGSEGEAS